MSQSNQVAEVTTKKDDNKASVAKTSPGVKMGATPSQKTASGGLKKLGVKAKSGGSKGGSNVSSKGK